MIEKKGLNLFVIGLILLVIIINTFSFINAEIILSQPNGLYNYGDELSFEIKLDNIQTGYLDVGLKCSEQNHTETINLYHNVPETTTINVKRKIINAYVGNLTGNCNILASYGLEEKSSQNFRVSKKIDLTFEVSNASYLAGKNFSVKGMAIKENNLLVGQDFNSYAEVTLQKANESITVNGVVKDGQFKVDFTIPDNTKAGTYNFFVKVFEKENDEILNEATASDSITVIQIPAKIELALNNVGINPGEEISLIPFLYDMAGDEMDKDIFIKIIGADSKVYFEGFVRTKENIILKTETNYAPGFVKIISQIDKIILEKGIEIKEMKKIKTEIVNQTLLVTNIGNIPYAGIVQVNIGNQTLNKEVDLGLNEQKEYYLTAPAGDYNIEIQSEKENFVYENVALTGKVISANAIGPAVFSNYPLVWAFILFILILAIFLGIRKVLADNRIHLPALRKEQRKNVEYFKKKGAVDIITPEKTRENVDKIILQGDVKKAQHEMVLHGKNQQAGIVALKIKSELYGIEKTSLDKALEYAYALKAVSYTSGDYVLLILSPLITKKNNNEELAIKVAIEIDNFLKEHNRKFRGNIINYGIGVNSGEIVNIVENNVLKFASINKTITLTKKIAGISNQEILLSKEIHEKTMNNIKAEKITEENSSGLDLFKIKRVVDNQASQKFINEFMKRQ